MIRGRQGRQGVRGIPLSTLLDMIWAEIWDDYGPMSDMHQYHEIITQLYIEGKDPHEVTYTTHDGKIKRLGRQSQVGGAPSKSAREEAKAMMERARQLAEAKALASQPNGRG